ncbi:MAG: hypothetical protein ACNA7E_01195, partial [Wenzhouxiangellaceae bacterium]
GNDCQTVIAREYGRPHDDRNSAAAQLPFQLAKAALVADPSVLNAVHHRHAPDVKVFMTKIRKFSRFQHFISHAPLADSMARKLRHAGLSQPIR